MSKFERLNCRLEKRGKISASPLEAFVLSRVSGLASLQNEETKLAMLQGNWSLVQSKTIVIRYNVL